MAAAAAQAASCRRWRPRRDDHTHVAACGADGRRPDRALGRTPWADPPGRPRAGTGAPASAVCCGLRGPRRPLCILRHSQPDRRRATVRLQPNRRPPNNTNTRRGRPARTTRRTGSSASQRLVVGGGSGTPPLTEGTVAAGTRVTCHETPADRGAHWTTRRWPGGSAWARPPWRGSGPTASPAIESATFKISNDPRRGQLIWRRCSVSARRPSARRGTAPNGACTSPRPRPPGPTYRALIQRTDRPAARRGVFTSVNELQEATERWATAGTTTPSPSCEKLPPTTSSNDSSRAGITHPPDQYEDGPLGARLRASYLVASSNSSRRPAGSRPLSATSRPWARAHSRARATRSCRSRRLPGLRWPPCTGRPAEAVFPGRPVGGVLPAWTPRAALRTSTAPTVSNFGKDLRIARCSSHTSSG